MKEMSTYGGLKPEKLDNYKNNNPAFKSSRFTLYFNDGHTFYQPESKETPASMDEWFSMVANDNVVSTNLESKQVSFQKHVFGNAFSVKDSVRNIQWKITSEMRTIAGFQCRRANALIMDSIYVVAFYTNEIAVQGGPELFTGLPGMILGLALPYEHITWFATSIYTDDPPAQLLSAPPDPKSISYQQFKEKIAEITKGWGKVAPLVMRKAVL